MSFHVTILSFLLLILGSFLGLIGCVFKKVLEIIYYSEQV